MDKKPNAPEETSEPEFKEEEELPSVRLWIRINVGVGASMWTVATVKVVIVWLGT